MTHAEATPPWLTRIRRRDAFAFRLECVLMGMQAGGVVFLLAIAPAWWAFVPPVVLAFVLVRDMNRLAWRVPA